MSLVLSKRDAQLRVAEIVTRSSSYPTNNVHVVGCADLFNFTENSCYRDDQTPLFLMILDVQKSHLLWAVRCCCTY